MLNMESQTFHELAVGDYVELDGQSYIKGINNTVIDSLGEVCTVYDSDFARLSVPDGVLSLKAITELPTGSSVIDLYGTLWHKRAAGRGQRWEDGDGESVSNANLSGLGVRSVEPPASVSERLTVVSVGAVPAGGWYLILKRKDGTTVNVTVDSWEKLRN
jgi:hypothetical protein